nr:MAG TPA: hypothetical protein [Caudoviricetes sp.]DAT10461.1 MAG TPA: hypothetical protein [Caudoviricetes sp.]DAY46933.1 MAG TPA: hypothetical protein [Caudoviricetes sp.]
MAGTNAPPRARKTVRETFCGRTKKVVNEQLRI